MLDSISPYALLCASKPKQQTSQPTPYDLYSAAQHHAALPETVKEPVSLPQERPYEAQRSAASLSSAQQKRTHYISDIHARHTSAARRSGGRQLFP